ncbi:hypothetical protein BCR32DRAFT_325072 [Anaeromyces robustus]|uniref:DUF567-domain-containing protein n=1 Tax=Anaeromyces robustus TaxID=1754192 RepID=A0A1Y1XLG4_9FUNG|nr:hypothetical protein BCR32DRAFT_325072 [Anaeromyces robustus]|eukprot:ORX86184.1 hypothetical protein BCR32DRAFT_325072 [Anaeromyces robustus]
MAVANNIFPPDHEISVFDKKFISQQYNTYTIKEGQHVIDNKGAALFDCIYEDNKVTVNDNSGKTIFNVRYNEIVYPIEKLTIYPENTDSKSLITFNLKRTFLSKKYIIDFFNQATQMNETIEMNCHSSFSNFDIYAGRKKDNSPLICKITKIKTQVLTGEDFIIEMAPNVDTLFMIAIGICVYKIYLNTYIVTSW